MKSIRADITNEEWRQFKAEAAQRGVPVAWLVAVALNQLLTKGTK